MDNIKSQIEATIKSFNFSQYGWTELARPLTLDFYQQWLENSYHGDMKYLEEHFDQKAKPQQLLKSAHSAIVLTENYFDNVPGQLPIEHLRVASYARGEDYHHWFKNKIQQLADKLKVLYPEEEFLCFTDSSPVLERDLAQRSGIGWFGKNTCVINQKKGSLFFIGEIYTSLSLPSWEVLHPDRCGTCTRCIDACPTAAIIEPYKMDARKCISYLTIESKKAAPQELKSKIGDWFFGCDICQTICPWNQKVFGEKVKQEVTANNNPQQVTKELQWILTASNKQLQKAFRGTALSRAGGNGLKRNAIIVAANLKLKELIPFIEALKPNIKLTETVTWALKQF